MPRLQPVAGRRSISALTRKRHRQCVKVRRPSSLRCADESEALCLPLDSSLRLWGGASAFLVPFLPLRGFSPRSVAGRLRWPGPAFAGLLALGRIRDGVVVVAGLVRLPSSGFDGFLRRVRRDESVAPADQVGPLRLDEG